MFYWVNQGKTFKAEKEGGYLWAPIKNAEGKSFFHWDNMTSLNPGDIVYNYRKNFLVGYCEIKSRSYLADRPKEFTSEANWEKQGNQVDADYFLFESPIHKEDIYNAISDQLSSKYSPFNAIIKNNELQIKVNQGYLYQLGDKVGNMIAEIARMPSEITSKKVQRESDTDEGKIPDITSRRGLVTSRVGQGEYRNKILKRWNHRCAITGSSVKEILIASHIVSWRDSTNKERVDVNNGILLSPVYDALFDRHFISFDDNGNIILSKDISKSEFLRFGITGDEKIENLSVGNKEYLKRHRNKLMNL